MKNYNSKRCEYEEQCGMGACDIGAYCEDFKPRSKAQFLKGKIIQEANEMWLTKHKHKQT